MILAVVRLLAEGGWLAVIYAALAVVAERRVPALGPLEMAIAVGVGALIARRTRESPDIGAVLLSLALAAGAVAGWFVAGESFSGAFLAAGVVRGAFVERNRDAAAPLEMLLLRALPLVGGVWAATLVASQPELVGAFSATALWGTLLLIAAAAIGIGLTRLAELHAALDDRPTRRAWQLLVVVVGLAIVPLGIPFGIASGIPIGALADPLLRVGQLLLGVLAIPFGIVAALLVGLASLIIPRGTQQVDSSPLAPPSAPPLPPDAGVSQDPLMGTAVAIVVLTVFGLLIIAGVLYYARWMIERPRADAARPAATRDVERAIVRPAVVRPAAAPRAAGESGSVHARDAVTAYLAALNDLSAVPDLARAPVETPARHALRLRAARAAVAPDVGRLAADYQVARYAGRALSRAEDRRALARLDRIRRLLSR